MISSNDYNVSLEDAEIIDSIIDCLTNLLTAAQASDTQKEKAYKMLDEIIINSNDLEKDLGQASPNIDNIIFEIISAGRG